MLEKCHPVPVLYQEDSDTTPMLHPFYSRQRHGAPAVPMLLRNETTHLLSDGVLHLDARVHFDEVVPLR